ncbi:MAG TPA: rod shape-determining protein MreD [Stellaceae bacterium]|nr:rod shape-determining protein MreD [Stellaceae bacterium]
MRIGIFQRDAETANRLIPFLSCFAALVLSVVPLHVPGLAIATPAFALMAVYHWTVYRPDLLPPAALFVLGVALDLLDGTPYLGLSALAFLAARSFVLVGRRRAVNRPFAFVWAGFLATAAFAIGLEWAMTSAISMSALSPRPFVFQTVVTVAAYPIADYLLAQLQRGLLRRA